VTVEAGGNLPIGVSGGGPIMWTNTGHTKLQTIAGGGNFELQHDLATIVMNSGTWELASEADSESQDRLQGSSELHNLAGGTLLKTGAGKGDIQGGGLLTFVTGSTIRVEEGELESDSSVDLKFNSSDPGSTLEGVNVEVLGGSTLDLQDYNTDINTIGSTASVHMSGASANWQDSGSDRLDDLMTVEGTLLVSDGFTLMPTGGDGNDLTIDGGVLGGAGGSIAGDVFVINGGVIAPGFNPTGTVNILGDVSWNADTAFNVNIAGLADFDQLFVEDNALLNDSLLELVLEYDPTVGDMFQILTTQAGMVNGLFANGNMVQATNADSGRTFEFDIVYEDTFVKLTALREVVDEEETAPVVPEPVTAMLGLLGLGGLAMRRRR